MCISVNAIIDLFSTTLSRINCGTSKHCNNGHLKYCLPNDGRARSLCSSSILCLYMFGEAFNYYRWFCGDQINKSVCVRLWSDYDFKISVDVLRSNTFSSPICVRFASIVQRDVTRHIASTGDSFLERFG